MTDKPDTNVPETNASLTAQASNLLVVEESKSFVEFDLWMDAEVEKLVARWIHTAAPNAERIALTSKRIGKNSR